MLDAIIPSSIQTRILDDNLSFEDDVGLTCEDAGPLFLIHFGQTMPEEYQGSSISWNAYPFQKYEGGACVCDVESEANTSVKSQRIILRHFKAFFGWRSKPSLDGGLHRTTSQRFGCLQVAQQIPSPAIRLLRTRKSTGGTSHWMFSSQMR